MAGSRRFTVQILGDAKSAKRAVAETENALGHLSVTGRATAGGLRVIGTGLKGLGVAAAGFAVAGTAAMVGFGRSVITTGIAYQDQLNAMQAVTHSTDAAMARVAQRARDLGNDLSLPATSAADAAQAMTELAKGNLSAAQAMQAAKGTLQLAAAAQIDGATAANIQARALNAFGLSATQAGHVADALANTANAASGEITDFALGLAQSSAVAHQFGLSLDDTLTVLGEFANAGIAGSDAGTSLKTALQSLAGASGPAAKALKTLGVDAFDSHGKFVGLRVVSQELADAQKRMSTEAFNAAVKLAFGSDAARAAGILAANGAAGFDKMSAAVGRAGGAAQVAQAKTKGLGGALQGLQSQFETVKIDVFTRQAPNLEKFIRALSERLPAAAEAGLRGLDRLTSFVEGEIPKARDVVQEFGPAVETWISGKLQLAAYAADQVAGPALRGLGNVLKGLAPQAEAAGQSVDGALRSAIEAAGRVAQQFERDSSGLGESVGQLARGVGQAAHDALPALNLALRGASAGAGAMVTSLSGVVSILSPFTTQALLAAGAIKGIQLTVGGFGAARAGIEKVTTAWGRMADRASFAAGVVTQRVGTALGKDLTTAGEAGGRAMTGVRSAFTAVGTALPVLGAGLAVLGFAFERQKQQVQENIDKFKALNDAMRLGGQAGADAAQQLDTLNRVAQNLSQSGNGIKENVGRALADQLNQARDASQRAHDALSEQDKAQEDVTISLNHYLDAVRQYGSTSDEAKLAEQGYRGALIDQKILQDALSDATDRSKQSLQDYTDRILYAAGSSTALASQELAVKEASLSLTSAAAASAAAIKEHGKGSLEAKEAALAYQRAQETLKGQILAAASAAKAAAIANDTSGDAQRAAAAGAAAQREELKKLVTTLAPGSPLRRYIQGLIDKLNAIPRDIRVGIAVHRTGSIDVGVGGISVHAKALGGPVKAGQPYVVGEKRPELFVPKQDGMIVPRVPATAGAGRPWNGGGGNTYNITVQVPATAHPAEVGKATVEAIVAYEKRSGARWRTG